MATKIIRRPDRAEGGITAEEKARMDEHAASWISNALRTDTVDRERLTQAIKDLYRVSGREEPIVVIVPSPRIMAFAGGFASAIWYLRKQTYSATDLATRSATDSATASATRSATDSATASATRSATDSATHSATDLATYSATDLATRLATYSATDSETRSATALATASATASATDSATDSATASATASATYSATDSATRLAIASATDLATASATDSATYSATRLATDLATDLATASATDSATYSATRLATDLATDLATASATDSATRIFIQLAHELLGEHAPLGLKCAANWYGYHQGGNMWSAWDCYLTAARDILGLRLSSHDAYEAWERCAKNGGFRLVHEKFCMVSDFPERLRLDEQNRPHCEDGPSHRWRDGWELYYWHGVLVTEQIVMRPQTLTIIQIESETNAEVRRVMIERYGTARYLKKSGAQIVHELPNDYFLRGLQGAKLYRKSRPEDSDIVMVAVQNSTPEPDGSIKEYWLRVNGSEYSGEAARNCHAAIASTWRHADGSLYFKDWRQYAPEFES